MGELVYMHAERKLRAAEKMAECLADIRRHPQADGFVLRRAKEGLRVWREATRSDDDEGGPEAA
jgi:hypothetical protein